MRMDEREKRQLQEALIAAQRLGLEQHLLLHFYADAEELATYTNEKGRFLIIGDDYGTKLGLKESTSPVLSIDPDATLPTRFVNSSILTLLACLAVCSERRPALAQAGNDEAAKIVAEIRDEIRALDARAVDNLENWWSVVLEQVEQGML
jgi:hypothetical protein